MKRTAETLEIAHQISDIRIKLRVAGLAILFLHEDSDDGGAIANMIFQLDDELEKLTEKVYPEEIEPGEPDQEDSER
jgi:hypothetical protein